MASFSPPLGVTTLLAASPAATEGPDQSPSRIHFTYTLTSDKTSSSEQRRTVPEVWTNLPTDDVAAATTERWHALELLPLSGQEQMKKNGAPLHTASVPVPREVGNYEYTYRLRDLDSGKVEWLGSADGNGKIRVVASSTRGASETAWDGPRLDGGGSGTEWKRFEGQAAVAVGTFRLREADGPQQFEIGEEIIPPEWLKVGATDGLVWEQSNPSWLAPRHLTGSHPLEALSPKSPAQLLVLRARPTEQHLEYRYLVLFPFSTNQVCSYLRGGGGGRATVQLRCEPDATTGEGIDAAGYLAVAWGSQGHLNEVIQLAVAAARASQSGETLSDLLANVRGESKILDAPKPLGVCTWNALSGGGSTPDDYTASAVLGWLDTLLAQGDQNRPLAAGAVKTVLLDDGWQDVSTYVDFDEPVDDTHANRKALKSFQCRREWYDLDDDGGDDNEAAAATVAGEADADATMAAAAQKSKKFSVDSGYEGSPDAVRHLRELDDEAREGTCYELRDVVRRIKAKGIERVGVWMTLCGYWDGLHPESALSDTYTLRRVTLRSPLDSSDQGHLYFPVLADLRAYYTDYFTSLHAAGVDFVKVDDQSKIDSFYEQEVGEDEEDGARPEKVGDLRQAMLHEMRAAADRIFGAQEDAVIHCMAGSPRIWGGDLAVLGAKCGRSIIRNSDDYFPDEVDSHRWHVALNSVMTVLTTALRLVPDLDMAQAEHPYAGLHLPFRAFSSAPVYATDVDSLRGWNKLVATTREGVRILQNRAPALNGAMLEGRLWDDVIGQDEKQNAPAALKVGLPVPSAHGAHLGVWNCSNAESVSTVVDASDAAAAFGRTISSLPDAARSMLLYDTDATFAREVQLADLERSAAQPQCFAPPLVAVQVGQKESKIFSLAPIFAVDGGGNSASFTVACLGLLGKVAGLASIRQIALDAAKGVADTDATPEVSTAAELADSRGDSEEIPSSVTSNLVRPAQSTGRTLPTPQGRLPYILAHLAGMFRNSSTDERGRTRAPPARTPKSELSAMAREFVRSPIRTLFHELRALVSFGYAALVWAAAGASNTGASTTATHSRAVTASSGSDSGADGDTLLSVEIDYVGDRLGFYFSVAARLDRIRFLLDGKEIATRFVRSNKHVPNIVEVDVEGAWKDTISENASKDEGGQKSWLVSLQHVQ